MPGKLPSLEGLTVRNLKLSMDPRLDMMGMQMLMKKYGAQAMSRRISDSMNAAAQGGNSGAWRDDQRATWISG